MTTKLTQHMTVYNTPNNDFTAKTTENHGREKLEDYSTSFV